MMDLLWKVVNLFHSGFLHYQHGSDLIAIDSWLSQTDFLVYLSDFKWDTIVLKHTLGKGSLFSSRTLNILIGHMLLVLKFCIRYGFLYTGTEFISKLDGLHILIKDGSTNLLWNICSDLIDKQLSLLI